MTGTYCTADAAGVDGCCPTGVFCTEHAVPSFGIATGQMPVSNAARNAGRPLAIFKAMAFLMNLGPTKASTQADASGVDSSGPVSDDLDSDGGKKGGGSGGGTSGARNGASIGRPHGIFGLPFLTTRTAMAEMTPAVVVRAEAEDAAAAAAADDDDDDTDPADTKKGGRGGRIGGGGTSAARRVRPLRLFSIPFTIARSANAYACVPSAHSATGTDSSTPETKFIGANPALTEGRNGTTLTNAAVGRPRPLALFGYFRCCWALGASSWPLGLEGASDSLRMPQPTHRAPQSTMLNTNAKR